MDAPFFVAAYHARKATSSTKNAMRARLFMVKYASEKTETEAHGNGGVFQAI